MPDPLCHRVMLVLEEECRNVQVVRVPVLPILPLGDRELSVSRNLCNKFSKASVPYVIDCVAVQVEALAYLRPLACFVALREAPQHPEPTVVNYMLVQASERLCAVEPSFADYADIGFDLEHVLEMELVGRGLVTDSLRKCDEEKRRRRRSIYQKSKEEELPSLVGAF